MLGSSVEKYDKADAPGDTSHFRALTTALISTVGYGNIVV